MHPTLRTWAAGLALAASITVAGCAGGPPATAVAEFGTSAKKTVDLIGEARATGIVLSDAVATENGAMAYLATGKASLTPTSSCITSQAEWDEKVFNPRLAAFKAVADYADALASATDAGSIDKIESSVDALAAAAQVGSSGPARVGVTLVASGLRAASAAQVRAAMRQAHPYLVAIAEELKERDFVALSRLYRSCFNQWVSLRVANLNALGRAGGSPAARFDVYLRSRPEAAALRARVEAVEKAGPIMDAFVEAHAKLMESDEGIEGIVEKFDKIAASVKSGIPLR
jgi:hypothetical protein